VNSNGAPKNPCGSDKTAFIKDDDRCWVKILSEHIQSKLMALESLLGREILWDHLRSKLEPEVRLCVSNRVATDFEIWTSLLNLGLDLVIPEERVHQRQRLDGG
jgi:hypothetical protein